VPYPLCFSKEYWGHFLLILIIHLSLASLAIIEAAAILNSFPSPLINDCWGIDILSKVFLPSINIVSGFVSSLFKAILTASSVALVMPILSNVFGETAPMP